MSWRVAAEARLVDAVKAHLVVMPIDRVGPLIARGAVAIDGRTGAIAELVRPGQLLDATVDASAFAPEPMQLRVAYEDRDLVVVVKPAAMHMHPLGAFRTGTLLNQLLGHAGARPPRERCERDLCTGERCASRSSASEDESSLAGQPWAAWRPHPVHRLDRAARGLVLVAKSGAVHEALRARFHAIARRYRATVLGHVANDAGTIDAPLARDPANSYRAAVVPGGARAVTHYRVIERGGGHSVVELQLETGRTHQIRAHLASLGHPIAGDTLYQGGPSAPAIELCAIELAFAHPSDGRPVIVRLDA